MIRPVVHDRVVVVAMLVTKLVSGVVTAHTCSIPNNYNHSPELTQSPCNRLLMPPAMETFQIRITPFKNFGKICLDYMASMMI